MTQDDIRLWYEAHGFEYLPGDWDERTEVGESASYQPQSAERVGRERVLGGLGIFDFGGVGGTGALINQVVKREEAGENVLPWGENQREDHAVLEALEEFFTPYLASMPHAKRRIIDEYLYGRKTQVNIAETLGVSQQAVSKRLAAALRWLMRTIADEQRFLAEVAGDYETMSAEDEELAWHSFNTFWEGRFGTPWPLRG